MGIPVTHCALLQPLVRVHHSPLPYHPSLLHSGALRSLWLPPSGPPCRGPHRETSRDTSPPPRASASKDDGPPTFKPPTLPTPSLDKSTLARSKSKRPPT